MKTALPAQLKPRDRAIITAAILIWCIWVGLNTQSMLRFDFESQAKSNPPAKLPVFKQGVGDAKLPSIFLILHPRCPCSNVSLEAFSHILERVKGRVNATIVFVKPSADLNDEWVQSKLWKSAKEIKTAELLVDEKGAIAKTFDAQISGQVLLYDEHGQLRYSGGLNEARGQQPSGVAEERLVSMINKKIAAKDANVSKGLPALGCPLHDGEKRCSSAVR